MPPQKPLPVTHKDFLLYGLSTTDAQDMAKEVLRRRLTKAELKRVYDYFGDFAGWDWRSVMEDAIEKAVKS